jgi:hypothetical protein
LQGAWQAYGRIIQVKKVRVYVEAPYDEDNMGAAGGLILLKYLSMERLIPK